MHSDEAHIPIPVMYLNHSMDVGGIETFILELARRFNGSGILPSIAIFRGGGSLEKNLANEDIPLIHLKKRDGIDIFMIYQLGRFLKKENIQIVHTNNFAAWFYGIIATRLLPGVKHVHTEHSNVSRKRRACIEKMLSCFTDNIVCVSDDVKQSMIINQGISGERLSVIHNGVDIDRFNLSAENKKNIRRQIGIAEDVPVVGIVARLHPVKDHENLLNAFLIIRKKNIDAVLLIVGDGELKETLVSKSWELGLADNIMFLGERQDIPELLNAMDIFILCSVSEGHNISLIEAMASGLPVVATSVGGNIEVVQEGITGNLVPTGDPQILAEKITRLIKDSAVRTEMGRKARERVIEKFSLDRMLEDYRAIYMRLYEETRI